MSSRVLKHAAVENVVWRSVAAVRLESPPEESVEQARQSQAELARKESEERLMRTQQQVEEAFHRGVAEGEKAARASFEQERLRSQERLAQILAETAALRSKLRKDAEADLVKLSIAIARRVLHRELTIDPTALQSLVSAALQRLGGAECLRVRTHATSAAALRQALARIEKAANVEVVEDPQLESGALVFDTDRGSVDASIDVQLKEIERGFCDRLGIR